MEERLHSRWVRTRPDESNWKAALDVQARSFRPSLRHVRDENSNNQLGRLSRQLKICTSRSVHFTAISRTTPLISNSRICVSVRTLGTRKSTNLAHCPYRNSSQVVQPVVRRR